MIKNFGIQKTWCINKAKDSYSIHYIVESLNQNSRIQKTLCIIFYHKICSNIHKLIRNKIALRWCIWCDINMIYLCILNIRCNDLPEDIIHYLIHPYYTTFRVDCSIRLLTADHKLNLTLILMTLRL